MTNPTLTQEYLVLSLGHWDPAIPAETIQQAIDEFYAWLDRRIAEGRMRMGQRLKPAGKRVLRDRIQDGPFTEAKEVVGGYWTILAGSLEEAAALAAENPCLRCGIYYEIRPIDPAPCSAYETTTETPAARRVAG